MGHTLESGRCSLPSASPVVTDQSLVTYGDSTSRFEGRKLPRSPDGSSTICAVLGRSAVFGTRKSGLRHHIVHVYTCEQSSLTVRLLAFPCSRLSKIAESIWCLASLPPQFPNTSARQSTGARSGTRLFAHSSSHLLLFYFFFPLLRPIEAVA